MNKFYLNAISLSLVLSLGLSGCQPSKNPAPAPMLVEAQVVKTQAWHANTQATATVLANQGATLKSEISGRITRVDFTPGKTVTKGDLLFEINPAELIAKVKMSQALAELEKANYQRALRLYAAHVISRADFDKAKSSAANNQAAFEAAQAELDKAIVRAPFAGDTGLDLVKEGDYVTEGQALVSLQQLDHLRIDFSIPEQYSNQLTLGDAVSVQPRDHDKRVYQGVLSAMDNTIDVGTRMLPVRATIQNTERRLLPGAFVDVSVFYGPQQAVIAVPQVAVVSLAEGDTVYRIVNGKAVATRVKLGTRFGDSILIDSGIQVGDTIITAGQLKLFDGAPVTQAAQALPAAQATQASKHG